MNSSFTIITVIRTSGSAPRHVGAKMIVRADGRTFGTIGGGALEHSAVKDSAEFLRTRKAGCKTYPLGPLLGQCCGGEVELFFEPFCEPKHVAVFGAGHISEELVPMLKKLGFSVTLVDERVERLELPAFQAADRKISELPSDALKGIEFNDRLHVIILTHAHIHDEQIVEYCLDKPLKYLGLIGSKTKWEKFKSRFKPRGFSDEQLARVTTPIGLDIGSETPFEIAVSIVGQLICMQSQP